MTAIVSFLTPVQEELRAVEALMRLQAEQYHPDLGAAMELLVSAGGKRIRPALTILTGKMLNATVDRLISMATAIEMLHTATLVHDDLIDSALLRRGMPTLNSKWSPGATVLTGDFIFARAAKLAAETQSVPVIQLFAETLTIIVNGEIVQLLGSRCRADRGNYMQRIYAKTASLFETSATSAALLANAAPEIVETMRSFGREIGIAFQIIDDILDYTGDQSTIGKPVGGDLRQGIVTLPALIYSENHPTEALSQALQQGRCLEDAEVDQLIEDIRKSDSIQQSFQEAETYVQRGIQRLSDLPAGTERYSLEELASYITQRKF